MNKPVGSQTTEGQTDTGRSPGGGSGNLLQYSCLGNSMDRGAWRVTVDGVARVRHDLVTVPPPPN